MGLQVLVADWERSGRPPVDAIRRLHSQRLGKKVFPLVVALADAERSVWLMGPNPDASPVGPLPEPQAARILQASLDEPHNGDVPVLAGASFNLWDPASQSGRHMPMRRAAS